jgi:hypothetical protein
MSLQIHHVLNRVVPDMARGFTIATKTQCQSMLMLAILKGDKRIKDQCMAIMSKLPD